jgi:hypothetical protein
MEDDMPYTVGGTHRFEHAAWADGEAWDLTGATVTLHFRRPDGTTFARTATITDAAAGEAEYTTLTTDLDTAGWWARAWEVTQGGVVVPGRERLFYVDPAP